jgi:hypothetical protein
MLVIPAAHLFPVMVFVIIVLLVIVVLVVAFAVTMPLCECAAATEEKYSECGRNSPFCLAGTGSYGQAIARQ